MLKKIGEKREKKVHKGRFLKISIVILLIILIILLYFGFGYFNKKPGSRVTITLENPLKEIIIANTNPDGTINMEEVIKQGVIEFDENYINYLLIALGVSKIHKSPIGYGNPRIELNLDDESWNSELGDVFITKRGMIENEDLRIKVSKEEAVKALLSLDIKQFMKDSVKNGNTQIETVAGEVELFSKGYLDMYKELTGDEAKLE